MTASKILLIGLPGSGKGTQAKLILEQYPLFYLSTGEMFREEMTARTAIGEEIRTLMDNGQYVNDNLTNRLVTEKIVGKNYLLDGYPRTITQAEHLDLINAPDLVLFLETDDEVVVQRILERGKTSNRPEDQTPELIQGRIDLFYETMKPVIIHYAQQEKLQAIRADSTPKKIFEKIQKVIETK